MTLMQSPDNSPLSKLDELMSQMPSEDASEAEISAFMDQVMANEEGAQMIRHFAEQITEGGALDQMLKSEEITVPALESSIRFIFRINLVGTPIYRRISIPADASFFHLHEVIRDSFGWLGTSPHAFQIFENGVLELTFSSASEEEHFCEIQNGVSQVIENGIREFIYLYDFESKWSHQVIMEEIVPAGERGSAKEAIPAVHDGAGLCPPEGCHGVEDFHLFLSGRHPLAKEYGLELVEKIKSGAFDPASVRFSI